MLDFEDLPGHLDYFCGSTVLSPEQRSSIQSSMIVLKHEMHLQKLLFWGCIYGIEADYFIAQGVVKDDVGNNWYNRKTFFSQNCSTWALLNPPTDSLKRIARLASGQRFTGDLSAEIDIPESPRVTAGDVGPAGDNDEEDVSKSTVNVKGSATSRSSEQSEAAPDTITEELRLIGIIAEIDDGTMLAPRGVFIRNHAGHVTENRSFEGLRGDEAGKLYNYVHVRPASRLFSKTLMERADLEPSIDFLDTAYDELATAPGSTWSLQYERGGAHVVLRSLLWPGYSFFHVPGTRRYGSLYVGTATYNIDFPFMV